MQFNIILIGKSEVN